MLLYLLPLFAPALLVAAAVFAFRRPGRRPLLVPRVAEMAALGAFLVAIATAALLIAVGPGGVSLSPSGFGLSVRVDTVSVIMLLLVSFVGWVVVRYAATYMDGEERQGAFTGWLCATLAAVLVAVQSGGMVQLALALIATNSLLHRLLVFYPGRVQAERAARKRIVVARAADACLVLATVLIGTALGTADIGAILEAARTGDVPAAVLWAGGLIAAAAFLISAQFPTNGWLTEVMETPTPVSALLHAGVINAGGFLLIRFADVMLLVPGVLAVLAIVAGFTALVGGLVMLTQPTVKTSLAWSTVAQMGFMMLQCALALFPLALLHIVAHSLYKAHAFLDSGGAVERVAATRRPGPVAVPNAAAVSKAFLLAIAIYAGLGAAYGFADKSPQAIALGAILILGVAYLIAQGLADAAPRALTRRTALYSVVAAVSYFALQAGALWLMDGTLPATPAPGPLEWAVIVVTVASFGVVAVAQAMFPNWAYHPAASGVRVHLSNGLYANAVFDRLLGGWATSRAQ